MTVTVTAVCAKNAGEEVDIIFCIYGDCQEKCERVTLTVSSRQYLKLGICKGVSDTDTFDYASHCADVWKATKKGMMLLGYGAISKKAMKSKLISKGFESEVSAEAAEELAILGLINDDSDASELARLLSLKLWGQKRIIAELYKKGYDSDAVRKAMNSLENMGVDYSKNCRALIKKKYGRIPEDRAERQKLFAALSRYGYSSAEIKEAFSSNE